MASEKSKFFEETFLKIQYLGQEGFYISDGSNTICIDLYLSNAVYERTGAGIRNYSSPIGIDDISLIDYYLITHGHLDHLDPDTVSKIGNQYKDVKFICPYPHIKELNDCGIENYRIIGAESCKWINLDGIKIYPIREKHEDYSLVNGKYSNLGYVIEMSGYRLFHAGDALADEDLMTDLSAFDMYDMAFLPINGHDWKRYKEGIMGNMTFREALDLANVIHANFVVPMHYDLFNNNTENPAFFVDYLYREYPRQRFKMFMPGEKMIVTREVLN